MRSRMQVKVCVEVYSHSHALTCASDTKAVSEILLLLTSSALHGNLPAQGRAEPKPKPSFPMTSAPRALEPSWEWLCSCCQI